MDDLLLARIEERHIHFIAQAGSPMDGLHEANILHTTDVVHGFQRGALIGAALGCAGGLLLVYTVIADQNWHVATVVLAALLGAGFGAWTSSMQRRRARARRWCGCRAHRASRSPWGRSR